MGKMPVIAIVNGKGGVGKTTTSVSLAALMGEHYKTLLIDTDPQGSASWWTERGDVPFEVTHESSPAQLKKMTQIQGYQACIVDTQPAIASEALTSVLSCSTFIVMPCPPATLDLQALTETISTSVIPAKVPYRILLTKVDTRQINNAFDAQASLIDRGFQVFISMIRAYAAHEQASFKGVPINQYKGKNAGEAAADYRRMLNELMRELEGMENGKA